MGSFLLKNRIAGTPLAERMVAAYLPGWTFSLTHDLAPCPAWEPAKMPLIPAVC
ncbi:hypothetical protein JCM17846_28350 [Iodidimonas nitroreducens]|uniref:Uncharacterized protein n=1 Tax=Iodidimonas nitroreducens TaxID=1236968 RepID=A0A5A7N9W5_9PROT|nr:hypothetical protein JCM17846_28350 [Iodidimonas nitroreducens]